MLSHEKLTKFESILLKNSFLHLSTILPDGSPHTTPLWFHYNSTTKLFSFSIEHGSIKDQNISRNAQVCLSIQDPDNPYHYVQIRGKVISKELDVNAEFSNSLFQKYSNNKLQRSWFEYSNPLYVVTIKPVHVTGWLEESASNFYNKINNNSIN